MADHSVNEDLAELLRSGEPIAVIAVDVSTEALQPASKGEGVRREVGEALERSGADAPTVAALLGAVAQVPGATDPIGVAAAASAGRVVTQQAPGEALRTLAEAGAVADLSPLLRARERALPVLVVESKAAGGTLRLYPAPGLAATLEQEVRGDDTLVQQAHAGGIAQSAHAHSAEDALKQNAEKLADQAARVARQHGVIGVLVTGDPRSAELTTQQLPQVEGVTVAALGKDEGAAGADPSDETGAVARFVDRAVSDAQQAVVDRMSAGDLRLGDVGVQAVMDALRGAAVDTLLVGPGGAEGDLIALDAEPWVAQSADDALGAGQLASAPAVAVLVRAAVLTGAAVRYPGPGVLPDDAPVAAYRRRPADE